MPDSLPLDIPDNELTGTPGQLDWAKLIRPRVAAEFDRVAAAFHAVAATQTGVRRADTLAVIAILQEKRVEVLAHRAAGYYIRDWRELNDQVRRIIADDPAYQAIQTGRKRA